MFAFAIHIDFMAVASKEGGTPSFLQSIASAARPNISAQVDTPGEFMALSNPNQCTPKPRFSKARFSK